MGLLHTRVLYVVTVALMVSSLVGCSGHRRTRAKPPSDAVIEAVVTFLSLRLDDYGDSYLLSDDVTGSRLHLNIVELPAHREAISPGAWVVGVVFGSGSSAEQRYEVDFVIETRADLHEVVEYRVHRAPVEEDGRWVLQERPIP